MVQLTIPLQISAPRYLMMKPYIKGWGVLKFYLKFSKQLTLKSQKCSCYVRREMPLKNYMHPEFIMEIA